MNNYTHDEVLALPLTDKERDHEGRNRKAKDIYLSRYHTEFSLLSVTEKNSLVGIETNDDNSSIDSTDTIVNKGPKLKDIMRLARQSWQQLNQQSKKGWEERAVWLNSRPKYGTFEIIPAELDVPTLDDNLKIALTFDFKKFRQSMRSTLTRRRARHHNVLSDATYKFGKEKVVLQSQRYKEFSFNYLLVLAIFGTGFRLLKDTELVESHKKKSTRIVHFSSIRRIREVFTHANVNGLQFFKQDKTYTCCGKVNTRSSETGRDMIGYITDENDSHWTIILGDNSTIQLPRGIYLEASGVYSFPPCAHSQRTITQFWPVRMKIYNNGDASFTFNRVCFDLEHNLILYNSS